MTSYIANNIFNYSPDMINRYIDLLLGISQRSSPAIAAIGIYQNSCIRITTNTLYEHAEEILLKYSDCMILFITLEPCPSCMFKISSSSIQSLFYIYENKQYGGFKYFQLSNVNSFCMRPGQKYDINLNR